MPIPKVTLGSLKPLRILSELQEHSSTHSNAPIVIDLALRNIFQTAFFVSQQEHCIFIEGLDWCHILLLFVDPLFFYLQSS